MKLAVIGGGSTYTPELIHGFLKMGLECPVDEIVLYDVDVKRLSLVGDYCIALSKTEGTGVRIYKSGNLKEALDGAGFVVTQIRVGGNETRVRDEIKAKELGIIAQETTGAVGFLKAYRTIPVMVDIARKIQLVCPEAFLINFTNPAGIISTAIHRATGKKNMAGLCNVPIFMQKKIVQLLKDYEDEAFDYSPDAVEMTWCGLNHLSWIFDYKLNNVSIFDHVLDVINRHDFDVSDYFYVNRPYMNHIRAIPSPYLRYFTDTGSVIKEQAGKPTRGQVVTGIEKNLLDIYRKEALRLKDKSPGSLPDLPEELSKRGGADYSRLAVQLVCDIISGDSRKMHILNVPDRNGFFCNPDKYIETSVRIQKGSTKAEPAGDFEYVYPWKIKISNEIRELVEKVANYEEIAVDAGLKQDRDIAANALLANPLVGKDCAADLMELL